jgi:hypothetical protein
MANPEIPNKDNSIVIRVDKLQEELKKNPKNPENAQIRGEIAKLRRELNRTTQLTTITKEGSKKLAEGKNMDTISPADLMRIDKEEWVRWEFLSKSFLYKQSVDNEGTIFQEATDGKDIREWDTLYVDFWKNKQANNRIWLGHMLGANIEYVKVNGRIWMRSIINHRVGYYIDNNARWYLPVFTGDTVSIPTAKEIEEFSETTKDRGLVKNTSQSDSDTANDAYISKLESSSLEAVEINVNIQESYDFWKSKWFTHEQASGIIANEYRESNANPRASGDNGQAKWIFQWHPDRCEAIRNGTGINIGTATHREQLEATYWEITQTAEKKVLAPLKTAKTAQEAAGIFSEMYERPGNREFEMNTRGEMAEAFAILLDTEWRSTNLWDHVVQRGPANLWANSCGAAVRALLKSYGIIGLPETGANGKNWESILDERSSQFIKMKIGHPDQAYPGAILVYNGSGSEWSAMNKEYGHVEIKGSDGKYYSYYEGSRAGGSAATGEKDPEKYESLTGFIWYAYYPRQKKA